MYYVKLNFMIASIKIRTPENTTQQFQSLQHHFYKVISLSTNENPTESLQCPLPLLYINSKFN